VLGAIIVVLIAALIGGYAITRSQWYVGVDGNRVALFQGVRTQPLGISLSDPKEHSLPVSCLPAFQQRELKNGIVAKSRTDGQRIVRDLEAQSTGPVPAPAPTAKPSPSERPAPSAGASARPRSPSPPSAAASSPASRGGSGQSGVASQAGNDCPPPRRTG
jgi:protein phosphatase